jgi:hypothetical protein
MMRKLLAIAFLLALSIVGLTGCEKLKELFPGVEVPLPEVPITVPVGVGPTPLFPNGVVLPRIIKKFNLDSIVKANTNNQFGAGDVTSVKLKSLTFSITDGANQANNLSNFENIKFAFSSNINTTPVSIADYNFADTYTTTANIIAANSPELVSYITGNELYYDVTVKPRRTVTQSFSVIVKATVIAK